MLLRWLLVLAVGIIAIVLLVAHRGQPTMLSTIQWDIQSVGARAADQAPLTSVALQTPTTGYYVGEFVGTCRTIGETSNDLLPGESSAILCSWMKDAVEIGVFDSGRGKEVRAIEYFEGRRDQSHARVLFPLNANE